MKRFSNILFVVGEHTGKESAALRRAVELANNNMAQLTLLNVMPELSATELLESKQLDMRHITSRIVSHSEERLTALAAGLELSMPAQTQVVFGKRYIEVILQVLDKNHDLVVKQAENPSWLDHIFDSDDMHLLRKCPVPVWLIKEESDKTYDNVMASIDLRFDSNTESRKQLNQTILEITASLSTSEFAGMHVLNVYDSPVADFASLWAGQPDKMEQELLQGEYYFRQKAADDALADLEKKLGTEAMQLLSPKVHLQPGKAAQQIPKMVKSLGIDLLVMGTVGRTGIPGLIIGNTAESVLSQVDCSVFAIKPSGFVSPVA